VKPKVASPELLWALALVPALVALALREHKRRQARLARLGDAGLLRDLSSGAEGPRRLLLRLSAIAAFAFLVVALSGPKWGERTELLPRRGLDVVFAIDVSRSMRARDVLPDRLARAQAEVSVVLDRLREHRVGLVAFAGSAFVQCPLTTDVEATRSFLRALEPEAVPQGGTALSAGLLTALNLFLAEEENDPDTAKAGRLLVVITDGEDHEGRLDEVAKSLKESGISLFLIGVGSQLGEPIPRTDENGRVIGYKKDRKGQTVMTRMAPEVLQRLADGAGGQFIEGATRPDLGIGDIEAAIGRMEKRDFESRIRRMDIDRAAWPLGLALLLLVLATLSEHARRNAKERVLPFVALGLFALVVVAGPLRAEEARWYERPEPNVEAGVEALGRGESDAAIERFRAAQAEAADERAAVEYDVGQALLFQAAAEAAAAAQSGDAVDPQEEAPGRDLLLQAGESFDRAYGIAQSPYLRSQSALAAGNAHARADQLDRSVDAYRRALVSDPMNEAARKNLSAVLQAMRAQPPPPPSGGGDDDREEKEDGDEEQEQQGEDKPEPSDQEQKQDDSEQSEDEQQQQQQEQQQEAQDQAGDEEKQQKPETKQGEETEDKPPSGGEKKEEEISKEQARRLLDALRQRERALNPLLMRPDDAKRQRTEKDW
jgi:Ca-activated chloride channel family protein